MAVGYVLVDADRKDASHRTYSCEDIRQYLGIILATMPDMFGGICWSLTSTSQRLLLSILGPSGHQTLHDVNQYRSQPLRAKRDAYRHFLIVLSAHRLWFCPVRAERYSHSRRGQSHDDQRQRDSSNQLSDLLLCMRLSCLGKVGKIILPGQRPCACGRGHSCLR